MELFLILLRMVFALYVAWCLLYVVVLLLGYSGGESEDVFYSPVPGQNFRRGGYSDKEILNQEFPDPRMAETDHRPLRHAFYRKQVEEVKRKKAIVAYSDGWVGILWSRLVGHDSVDSVEEVDDVVR